MFELSRCTWNIAHLSWCRRWALGVGLGRTRSVALIDEQRRDFCQATIGWIGLRYRLQNAEHSLEEYKISRE